VEFLDRLEVRVLHGVLRGDALCVVVPEHLGEQVESLISDKMLVLAMNELVPRLLGVLPEDVIVVGVESHAVLVDVGEEFVSAEDLGDLYELVVVVLPLEEGLLLEDHAGEHAPEGPNVEGVVVGLQVDEELGALEVAGGHADVVLLARVVEFGQTPVDESQLPRGVVDHDVVGLNVTVGDALGVAVVERSQHFKDVVADVEISEALVESAEINVAGVHILHDERGCLGHGVAHHVDEIDDVDAALKGLEDLDLTADLGLLDRLQDLDHNPLLIRCVDTLIDLRVLPAAYLFDDLVVLLRPIPQ